MTKSAPDESVVASQLAEHHARAVDNDLAKTAGGGLSHDEAARQVRMLLRTDFNHEAVCQIGRDRIVWLARQLSAAEQKHTALLARIGELADRLDKRDLHIPNPANLFSLLDLVSAELRTLASKDDPT